VEDAFIIMQIGDPEMDRVCDEAMVPAIQSAGLVPRRVDRDNAGDLLKAEIVSFLERSRIIVADLTNERPNCYLEVGYAMGLGKKPNLILMAREDHHHRSPNYRVDGLRVHFDPKATTCCSGIPRSLVSSATSSRRVSNAG
jgi:nucleoside 2-deoxyribosyltransferase